MLYRNLGKSGLEISCLTVGTSGFGRREMDLKTSIEVINESIELGINSFDTANTYGLAEEFLGKALQSHRRETTIIATKVGSPIGTGPNNQGTSRKHIKIQLENSLRKLQTDYIDLYQLHTPDKLTPIDETIKTLDQFIRSGKIRYIGCSNYSSWQVSQLVEIQRYLGINNLVSVQPEYNILRRSIEKELIPCCKEYGLGILAYHPLDSGFLTGKYTDTGQLPIGSRFYNVPQLVEQHFTNKRFKILENLQNFVHENKRSLIELAIAWLLSRPMVDSVIVGSSRKGQIRACVEGVNWVLDKTQLSKIEKLLV